MQLSDGGAMFGDDDPGLPPARPFSPRLPGDHDQHIEQANEHSQRATSMLDTEHTTSSASAPQRRVQAVRAIEADARPELTNRQLGEWSTNYLANMAEATSLKEQARSLAQAKKNAAFWVLGQGIGGVEASFGADRMSHPLAIFSGQALLDALVGTTTSPAGTKRARGQLYEDDEEEQTRRVRPRGEEEEQVGRGEEGEVMLGQDEGLMFQGDDYNIVSSISGRVLRR